jgi:hypothetical protein
MNGQIAALKNQDQIQALFNAAAKEGIPPYDWIPPIWDAKSAPPTLEDNAANAGNFAPYDPDPNHAPKYAKIEDLLNFRKGTQVEGDKDYDPAGPDGKKERKAWHWPTADASTEHHLGTPSENAKGMRRLSALFEWAIIRATVTLNDINRALDFATKKSNQDTLEDFGNFQFPNATDMYTAARDNYLSFLRDFDEHEAKYGNPDLGTPLTYPKDKGRQSGYGKALRWAYIDPVIVDGRIQATRIIMLWNPHSSSLGVPIKH